MGTLDRSWNSETEFAFNSQQEALYPMLLRMQQDFDFKVVVKAGAYLLSTREYLDINSVEVSPSFQTLDALEQYINKNMVDILYSYLFDIPSQDVKELPSSYAIA
ncbi:hypothetical protein [uncultured Pseudoteredinibacter sp.]|uniref:hypothetical protein n=1 Tax=uncultured Pseudoteredinibacter sp. TaxID=1641701 RepID=UPI0026296837|nr:hypothetical protein [uncultured Pseudoteredinibacter sp.]